MELKFFEVILFVSLVHLIAFYEARTFTWGELGYFDKNKLIDTKLIEHNSTIPKNYTIIYRYYQNYMKPVSYIEINVNNDSESTGRIERSTSQQYYYVKSREIFLFTAEIHVKNARNVLATLTIWEKDYLPFTYVLEGGPENNKSLTFLYVQDALPVSTQVVRSSIGKRQPGDELIHYKSKNVTNHNRFPSRAFSYSGDDEYLTCVRFAFNSPTAMVLVNTSYVGEQKFNAIVYDMNAEHFTAKIFVFGIKSNGGRPKGFMPILDLQT